MDEAGRFAFGDPWHNPDDLFPSFMTELKLRYPDYGLVYDRRREQWLIFHQITASHLKHVAYCENGDGTAAEPSMEVLDRLTQADILRTFISADAYCDYLEKEQERRDVEGLAKLDEEMVYAGKPIRDWIAGGGRETVILRPISDEHRRQVERSLNLSAAANRTETSEATCQHQP